MSLSRIHLTASLYLCPAACFQDILFEQAGKSHWTSWHFSDISRDILAPWAHESTSLDVNKANGMLTSNAKRIFCDNVTCFETSKNCSNQSHLQECFNCSSLLACKGTALNLFSNESFKHTPYSFPLSVSCRLFSRHYVRTSWEFSPEQVGISPTYHVTCSVGA